MKTPPDAVLAPDAVAGLAWDEHGGKRLLLATRFIFLKPDAVCRYTRGDQVG
jgi:hypothetical protein